ncbi:HlyD family efflux transporter periplasmic adaptor subunit [Aliikangiella marina]|uniref:HlyD family efflux transporter periplasmic adaptor subunit n=1 Tax=Aliikangiella marina TaxID=1712262 RepID=A0A545TGU9_9GAMM|nr:HlyD family efflux transporter periplasmic adaptor subunit [Aliikangiella marina]TQV76462.1 HlyD family efflux transporter periplasmic adaptor subunit [Aliikangiella marina]
MKISDTSGQDIILEKPAGRRRLFYIIGSVVLLAIVITFAAPAFSRWTSADHSVAYERIRLAKVSRGDFIRDVSVQGKIVAAVSPTLYASAPGTISFTVTAGEQVKAKQLLGSIDSPELTNQLQQEEATLQSMVIDKDRQLIQSKKQALENQKVVDLAKVTLNAADREMRRAEAAYQRNAISTLDYEKAQDDLQNAKLAHQHAVQDANLNKESLDFELKTKRLEVQRQQLLVDELNRQVKELQLLSPVDGIVGQLVVEEKTAIAKNQAVISVVDLSQFEVEVAVPESYADDLGLGMAAEIRAGNQLHQATLVSISPEIQNNQVLGRVRFTQTPPEGLRQNQRLTTRILLEKKENVLMVKRGQFLDSGAGRVAYRVNGDVAEKITIKTGARSLAAVEILEGLQANDQIIISSTDSFQGAENVLINR